MSRLKNTLKNGVYYMYMGYRIIQKLLKGEKNNRIIKNRNVEKPLHILMNGPSLYKTIDFVNQKPGDIMVANWAIKDSNIMKLNPKYLCVFDPLFALDNDYMQLVHIIQEEKEQLEAFMPEIVYDKYVSLYGKQSVHKVNNICMKRLYESRVDHKFYKKNWEMPIVSTVSVAALYIGIQLGYNKIYLHGNDFSWMKDIDVDEDGKIVKNDRYFYGNKKEYLEKSMLEYSDAIYSGFLGFYNVARYAEDEHVTIVNMATESYIDCFEKYTEPNKYV